MSSDERAREVYFDDEELTWWYSIEHEHGRTHFGPYPTEETATEAMRLHGLEE